ncbi:balbiani ring protein 3-like isoform X2 [Daphnia carinata]|uniref:balbiani ring protein 3-like isoform X2 n=1 Tax=Daphnia carinata TaxID=120202 RepID=UPI0028686744|nr:balbiani ring protein 3-like isoform X2 [Daphnia carinata]
MEYSNVIAFLLLMMNLTYTSTSRIGRHTNGDFSRTSDGENPIDPEYEFQIRLGRVSSLEALLLETIRVGGTEICSSPFTRSVMLGTWRHNTPDRDELRDNLELRKTCYNALLKDSSTNAASTPVAASHFLMNDSPPDHEFDNSSAHQDLTFTLLSPAGNVAVPLRMLRTGIPPPDSPRKREATPKPEVLRKSNEIIRDRSAECKPRKIPVEIPKEPNITWWPACTLVERCGGCCNNERLQCVPVPEAITIIKTQVIDVNSKGVTVNYKQVQIEKHNKCKCQCKVKASDCNPQQVYDKNNCKCVCKQNGSKPGKPVQQICKAPLYWDERSCKCRCPPQIDVECSTGSFFSSEQCRCVTASEIFEEEITKRM